jgi:hypothetical protein
VTSVNHADVQAPLPTASDIRTAIPQCPQLGPIFNYLRTGQLPTDAQAARRIVYESENYIIEDDLLYFLYTPRTRKLDRAHVVLKLLCIPEIFRHNIAVALHDFNTHIGFQRLYATCKLRYYFKNMYQFLREHVLTCQVCQEAKRPTHPQQIPIQATPMAKPFHVGSWMFMDLSQTRQTQIAIPKDLIVTLLLSSINARCGRNCAQYQTSQRRQLFELFLIILFHDMEFLFRWLFNQITLQILLQN